MLWTQPEEVADIVGLGTKRPIEYLIRAARKLEFRDGGVGPIYGKIFMAPA